MFHRYEILSSTQTKHKLSLPENRALRNIVGPRARRDSSVGIVMGYGLDDRGSNPGGGNISFTSTSSMSALLLARPLIRLYSLVISPYVSRPGRKSDHLSPSSAVVKNGGDVPLLPLLLCIHILMLN
jgi:hypothetical protein